MKRILKSQPKLRQASLWARSLVRKILRGYRRYTGIPGRIHYDDAAFYDANSAHYIQTAESAIENIEICLSSIQKNLKNIGSCLDLPCGYGRVLRFLLDHLNGSAALDACDIEKKAVEFCAREFKVNPILSQQDISLVSFPRKYDLIWMGSLITHLPREAINNTFKSMGKILNKEGVFVFTTHGPTCLTILDSYGVGSPDRFIVEKSLTESGYYFIPYAGDKEYGITLTTKEFIVKSIHEATDGRMKLIFYRPEGWDNHQDVFGFSMYNLDKTKVKELYYNKFS